MAKYRVAITYSDGTLRTLETTDGKRAMQEASSSFYEEDGVAKTVVLEKDGEAIWTEKVKAYKPTEAKG